MLDFFIKCLHLLKRRTDKPKTCMHNLVRSFVNLVFQTETKDEIAALQKESEVPLDELLESLPKEILEKPASLPSEKDEVDKVL